MNIWVCKNIESGAAGYTYYPSSLAGEFGETNDGIVVRYDYVGSIGESSPGRSQTLTHEVGHWIDLPHLWGSTNQPNLESNCDTDDDLIDTPNTIGWTSCSLNGQTCGSLDNVENFMEYSFCGKMFTEGQKARMLASLTSTIAERNNLWSEQNLIDTGVLEEGVLCEAEFSVDRYAICVGESVQFTDESYSNVSARTWIFEGGNPVLSEDANPQIQYTVPGQYAVSLAVTDEDGNLLTRVKEAYIDVVDTSVIELPYAEDFSPHENLDQLEDQTLYAENIYDENVWELSTEVGYDDSHSAVFRATEASNSDIVESVLVSKPFSMSQIEGHPILSFKRAAARSSSDSNGELIVSISRNCGAFWTLRRILDDGEMYTTDEIHPNGFIPSQEDWETIVIQNISSTFHTEDFRIRFEYRGFEGGTVYLDDINLIDQLPLNTIEESADEFKIALYPNPADDRVTIKSPEAFEEIRLLDISGRTIERISIPNGSVTEYQLMLREMPLGLYLVEARINGQPVTGKLIID
jgi:PKD repeat protein